MVHLFIKEDKMPQQQTREDLFGRVSDIREANWIIEGLAMEQGLTMIFGDKGQGKTSLSLQILHTMLSQNKLFGLETNPVNTFIVEQDESPRIFRNHRDRVLRELPTLEDMEIPKVFVTWLPNSGDFDNLVDLIRAFPAKLVIIDSFTSLGIPDINHPNTSSVLDRLRQINAEEDCSIILLHHVNRKGDILGSVTLQIKVDNLIEMREIY
jgi:RecA-family ATPase